MTILPYRIYRFSFLLILISFTACNSGMDFPTKKAEFTGKVFMEGVPLEEKQIITIEIDGNSYEGSINNSTGSFSVETCIVLTGKTYNITIANELYCKSKSAVFSLDNFSFNLGNIYFGAECITGISPPDLTSSLVNGGYYNEPVQFSLTGIENASLEYSIDDGNTWHSYENTVTILDNGTYSIVVRQILDNEISLESEAINITIDRTPPEAPVISGITNGEHIVGEMFIVTGEENSDIEYSLDNGSTWLAYTGEVTLNDPGDFILTARQSDCAGNISVQATAISVTMNPYLVSIDIWQETPPVVMTQTQQFRATALYSDNSTVDVTSETSWNSSNESVATINSTGLLTIVSTGTTTVDALFQGKMDDESFPVVLRYNHIRQKSVHNTYERDEAIQDVLIYHRVRSIEYDLWTYKSGYSSENQNWFIYHTPVVSHGTSVHMLDDGLDELKAFHNAVPDHEVVTVWMDIKNGWENNRNPADLDARLEMELGLELIFKPSDMMARAPDATTLRQVIDSAKWPALSELKGKFVFVLTDSTDRLVEYVDNGSTAASRYAFVAPGISSSDQIDDYSFQIFFNMNNDDVNCALDVYNSGYVSRAYYVDSESNNNTARQKKVHHIAADQTNYHEDSWTVTHSANGWPFNLMSFTVNDDFEEQANIIGVIVDSGDIWGNYDDFAMYYNYISNASTERSYSAFVSTPNSHIDEWGKGCLMARNTFDGKNRGEGSAYFAVCRPADSNKIRVQYRKSWTGDTSAVDKDIVASNTIDQENLIHIKIEIYSNSTCARGWGSQDGENWVLIHQECGFDSVPLRYDGIAVSSHDNSSSVKYLFGNLTYSDAGGSEAYSRSDLAGFKGIGNGYYSSSIFDGIFQ